MTRQTYSTDQIKDMLRDRLDAVLDRYAPEAPGSYRDARKGLYFTLNPGRVDRSVGSFCVDLRGAKPGNWRDYATGAHGDIVDLIALRLACSVKDAFAEARAFLGLENATPAQQKALAEAAERGRRQRAEADKRARADRARVVRHAQAVFLSAQERLRNTPVDHYLREARGIDLSALGRQPGVLRYAPDLFYTHTDPETGEVIEARFPAMVAAITGADGKICAVHRTWLAQDARGIWVKAPVPEAKKVLGDYRAAAIHVWRGIGPRGGKPVALSQAAPGAHVYITEGVEDALSVVALLPDVRVLAAISLGNLGQLALPEAVAEVTLVADLDENSAAADALQRAIAQHQAAGRTVRLWQNSWGGKDVNDALRAAMGRAGGAV